MRIEHFPGGDIKYVSIPDANTRGGFVIIMSDHEVCWSAWDVCTGDSIAFRSLPEMCQQARQHGWDVSDGALTMIYDHWMRHVQSQCYETILHTRMECCQEMMV